MSVSLPTGAAGSRCQEMNDIKSTTLFVSLGFSLFFNRRISKGDLAVSFCRYISQKDINNNNKTFIKVTPPWAKAGLLSVCTTTTLICHPASQP